GHLRRLEARLKEQEAADRSEAPQRALLLKDEATARKFLRYHAEARTAFHKAYAQLLKTLERDRAEGAPGDDVGADSPHEPEPSPEPSEAGGPDAATSPNEANSAEPAAAVAAETEITEEVVAIEPVGGVELPAGPAPVLAAGPMAAV